MSVAVIGLALGLNATSPAITSEMNPHMLAADRRYQELVYQHNPVFRVAQTEASRLVLRQRTRPERRAAGDAQTETR